jgi:hypothetical protein
MKKTADRILALLFLLVPVTGLVADEPMIDQSFNDPEAVPFLSSEHGQVNLVRAESTVSNVEGGLSLYIKDTSSEGGPVGSFDLEATANKPLKISFDYYLDGLNQAVQAFQVRGPEGQGLLLVLSQWDGSGTAYHNGEAPQKLGKLFKQGKWYRVTLKLPPRKTAGKTFSLVLTNDKGETILEREGLKFKNYLSDYSSINFFFNNGPKSRGSSFLVDNLVVEVMDE